MGKAPQIGTVTEDGKVTVSLGVRAWIGVGFAVVVAISAVIGFVNIVKKADKFMERSEVSEAKQDSVVATYGWRLRRLERKTGITWGGGSGDRRSRNQRDD